MISSSNPVGYIKQEHPSATLPLPTESLLTESTAVAASAAATTTAVSTLLPPPSTAPMSTPSTAAATTTTTTPTSASAAAAPRGLYRYPIFEHLDRTVYQIPD